MKIPMHGFMAKFVLPRVMKADEAERLCAILKTLVTPEEK